MKTNHTSFWIVVKNQKPLVIATGHDSNRGIPIFTDQRLAVQYINARGSSGNIHPYEVDISGLVNLLENIIEILNKGGVEWLVIDHPGESKERVAHIKIPEFLQKARMKPSIRLSTVPSPNPTS